ncbi:MULTISPECIES: glycosyltransferase [Bizionia]|uniref:Glycosyltransferase n=1 Tax=Bizionia algoritergicola TaxID=291187 RepID=A0A5D0QQY2_9FLAO|nr:MULTISPECIES: glycosyltransferase [Bizionia]OBX23247.1 hypothetical protein BAA08_05490 [Bizionia sp. APA-3]TYB71620.1 glycosyltransferase [Bizionia algoritergicola]
MLITIITINYNNLEGLRRTMLSVLNQSYKSVEYIIIDGNSNDGSSTFIEEYSDDLAFWVSEPDDGIYQAMNKGINKASGDYILFLNSGDYLVSDFILEKAITYDFQEDLIYGNLLLFNNRKPEIKEFPKILGFSYFFDKGYLPHPATFIKRSLFNTIHYYREDFKIVSDWDFLVSAVCKHNVSYKHIDLLITVYDTDGISGNPEFRSILLSEKKQSLLDNFPAFYEDAKKALSDTDFFKSHEYKRYSEIKSNKLMGKLNDLWMTLLHKSLKAVKKIKSIVGVFKVEKKRNLKSVFPGSKNYWEERYVRKGNSGSGSYGRLADYKAEYLNDFVSENEINTVVEFGCGDGNQLTLANYKNYIGFDVSKRAIEICLSEFKGDNSKSFYTVNDVLYGTIKSELILSLDVIYHLTEENIFKQYLTKLFEASTKYVIIYSSNYDFRIAEHVRSWKFTDWIEKNLSSEWKLETFSANKYQFDTTKPNDTSMSDFYVYKRLNSD